MSDVVVIGAGLAGLTAALRLREAGASVTLATFGIGGLPLSQGTIDVLGYAPGRVGDPFAAMASLPSDHPYALIGADAVRHGVDAMARWSGGLLTAPEPGRVNHLVPTAAGVLRPTWAVPTSMSFDVADAPSVLVIGIRQLRDFHAAWMAANLQRSCSGVVRHAEIDFLARGPEPDQTSLAIARALDDDAALRRLADAMAPHVTPDDVVVLPAVLGHRTPADARLTEMLGAPVVEVPMLPPSVPGIRLNDRLTTAVKRARARWILGSKVYGGTISDGRITDVTLWSSGSPKTLRADHVVLATGGFESGGLRMDSHGVLSEPVLDLPVCAPEGELVRGDALGWDQPLFTAGLRVDEYMRPLRGDEPVAENLYALGGLLAGAQRWNEKSGDGIAIGSAWKATTHILEGLA